MLGHEVGANDALQDMQWCDPRQVDVVRELRQRLGNVVRRSRARVSDVQLSVTFV